MKYGNDAATREWAANQFVPGRESSLDRLHEQNQRRSVIGDNPILNRVIGDSQANRDADPNYQLSWSSYARDRTYAAPLYDAPLIDQDLSGRKLGTSILGMGSGALGVLGGVGLVGVGFATTEAIIGVPISIYGGTMVVKSAADFSLNAKNAFTYFNGERRESAYVPGSLAEYVVKQNGGSASAQRAAVAADMVFSLPAGRLGPAPSALERTYQFMDVSEKSVTNIYEPLLDMNK